MECLTEMLSWWIDNDHEASITNLNTAIKKLAVDSNGMITNFFCMYMQYICITQVLNGIPFIILTIDNSIDHLHDCRNNVCLHKMGLYVWLGNKVWIVFFSIKQWLSLNSCCINFFKLTSQHLTK